MSSRKKWQRECLELARKAGILAPQLKPGGKHLKLTGTYNGRMVLFTVSHTANGGMRGVRNLRADINRALRAHS